MIPRITYSIPSKSLLMLSGRSLNFVVFVKGGPPAGCCVVVALITRVVSQRTIIKSPELGDVPQVTAGSVSAVRGGMRE